MSAVEVNAKNLVNKEVSTSTGILFPFHTFHYPTNILL